MILNFCLFYFLFISDDYRLTACMNILKFAIQQNLDGVIQPEEGAVSTSPGPDAKPDQAASAENKTTCTNPDCTRSRPNNTEDNKCVCQLADTSKSSITQPGAATDNKSANATVKKDDSKAPGDPKCKYKYD